MNSDDRRPVSQFLWKMGSSFRNITITLHGMDSQAQSGLCQKGPDRFKTLF